MACPHCDWRFASKKGVNRHIHTAHEGLAEGKSPKRDCPYPGCKVRQREDNVSRHHWKVHKRLIRWKQGEAVVR